MSLFERKEASGNAYFILERQVDLLKIHGEDLNQLFLALRS